MYPVPVNVPTLSGANSTETVLINICVHDCPTVNFQMVNNPELGRCEFLGFYCSYGNYTHGCLAAVQPQQYSLVDRNTLNMSKTSFGEVKGLNRTYSASNMTSNPEIFKVSNNKVAVTPQPVGREGNVPFCRLAAQNNQSMCSLCQNGYLSPRNMPTDRCVLRCDDGYYP